MADRGCGLREGKGEAVRATGDGSARVCEWLGRAEKRIHCSDSPASVAWQVAQYHASTSGSTASGGCWPHTTIG